MLLVTLRTDPPADAHAVEALLRSSAEVVAKVDHGERALLVCRAPGEALLRERVAGWPAVERAVCIGSRYVLSAREAAPGRTAVRLGTDLVVGGEEFVVIAGPCSVESAQQTLATAQAVRRAGARALRGGAFKPRTSPFSFQGLKEQGLEILQSVRAQTGLPVVSELLDVDDLRAIDEAVDVLQIGMRNSLNYALLREVGALRSRRPVLLKCGVGTSLEEFLCAADYVLCGGNPNVILCLRGTVGFSQESRASLNICDIAALRQRTHLPIIVDPSHAAGDWRLVPAICASALVAGADGLLIEVHEDPEHALSDGEQSLKPARLRQLMHRLRLLAPVVGRSVAAGDDALEGAGHPMEELCLEPPAEAAPALAKRAPARSVTSAVHPLPEAASPALAQRPAPAPTPAPCALEARRGES